MTSPAGPRIEVPEALVSWHRKFFGETGRAWIDAAPDLAAGLLDRWQLQPDGAPTCGATALVLPVVRADATPAVLKLQPVTDHTVGEPDALRVWNGNGAVRLLDHDPESGSMLLERLDADRSLATVRDDLAALRDPVRAPRPAQRRSRTRRHAPAIRFRRRPTRPCTTRPDARARSIATPPHPSLRFRARGGALRSRRPPRARGSALRQHPGPHPADQREPWLAIDPNPVAGDPGFALLAALHNRWEEAVATGDVPRAIRRRFDLMTDILGLDRKRATAWTLARILQNALWDVEHDDTMWHTEPDRAIAQTLLDTAG